MKVLDLSLESIRINGKDVVSILGIAWIAFLLYGRFLAVEAGLLELRISTLHMELSYMENRERTEQENRIYELKMDLVKKLQDKLEEYQ